MRHGQARRHGALHVVLVHEAVTARRDDQQGVAPVEVGDELRERLVAQEIAPDHRRVEFADPEIDERLVGMAQRLRVQPLARRAFEGGLRLRVGDAEMADIALSDEALPIHRRKHVGIDARRARGVAPLREAEFGARDREAGSKQRLVENTHRGGGLGDAVDDGDRAVGAAAAVRRPDLDRLLERFAGILFDEIEQWLGAEPVHEHRLMERDDAHVQKRPVRRERHEQVDGRAGETGDRREVHRFVDIGDKLILGRVLFEDRPDGKLVVLLAEDERRRERAFEIGARQHAGPRRRHRPDPDRQAQGDRQGDTFSLHPSSPSEGSRDCGRGNWT